MIRKFFGAFNNIFRVIGSKNEMVAFHLIKSYCLPSLLYSCETWHARSDDIRSANIALNNSFRKVFNSFWRESVKPLLMYCWCLPVSVLIHQRRFVVLERNAHLEIIPSWCCRRCVRFIQIDYKRSVPSTRRQLRTYFFNHK